MRFYVETFKPLSNFPCPPIAFLELVLNKKQEMILSLNFYLYGAALAGRTTWHILSFNKNLPVDQEDYYSSENNFWLLLIILF